MAVVVARPRSRTHALDALGHSLRGTIAAVRRLRGRDSHRPGVLSQAQYQVLFELLQTGELPAGELAAVADVSPASMTQMLDRLAEAGLVERVRSDLDRRIVSARLTTAGRRVCEERRAELEPLWRGMLEGFTASELQTAALVLDRITALFQHLAGGSDER
jgi:MarR family transcriptional regulator, organic hydroperoxide resistance regulator